MQYGFVLALYSLLIISCSTVQKEYIPVYKEPINTCIKPVNYPTCDDLQYAETDMEKFTVLLDCLVEFKLHRETMKSYYVCLEQHFKKDTNEQYNKK